jgi:hypothetical protein
MATVKGKNEGKSMFLKEYLVDTRTPGRRRSTRRGAYFRASAMGIEPKSPGSVATVSFFMDLGGTLISK